MAASFIGGAALGAVFGEVLKAILAEKTKVMMFKSSLKRLEFTLQRVIPIITEIESLNKLLDRPEEEVGVLVGKMNEARELIHKCSKVRCLDFYKKARYTRKLDKLDQLIIRFFQLDMQAQQTRDQREILLGVKSLRTDINKLSLNEKNGGGFNQMELKEPCSVPDPPLLTVGLDVPLSDLKMKLLKDGTSVTVVSAPGGCGKTTLIEKLCQDKEVKGKFKDNIFFVTVSRVPNLKLIVQKLFKHKGYKALELLNDKDAVNHLQQLLRQIGHDPILLVLDDVWSGSESLLDQFVFQLVDYKILVTSRSVFPKFGSPYHLKPLNIEDALALFSQSAFLQDGNSYKPDKDLLDKILKVCKGFPLALKVVGRSLCGQPPAIWKSQVLEWSKGASIFESSSDLLDCLQSSLDALDAVDRRLKECYLDLGAFPEDQRIPASALIDMWVELYELDEDGFQAMANLQKLSSRNLLNLVNSGKDESEVDGFYNEHFVMQHDLLKDLAILQSSLEQLAARKRFTVDINRNNFPKWWLEQKQPFNARLLSISTDETFLSRWHNIQAPELEVLVLNFSSKNYALPEFMEKLDKLKVLLVTNHGFFPAELNNSSLVGSLSNLKRIRLENVSMTSLSLSAIQLKNLRKISLNMCSIGEAFRNSPVQIFSAFPNLEEIDVDYCNDLEELPDGVCNIIQLKKLSITNCHKLSTLPENIGNLVNLKMLRLNSCIDLLELPDTVGNLYNLAYLDISDCLSISKLPEQIGELRSLRKLCMRECSSCELPPSIVNLEHVEVICDEETAFLWRRFEPHLKIQKITVPKEHINLNWLSL